MEDPTLTVVIQTPQEDNNHTQREEYLDGLRGWAALSVALLHSTVIIPINRLFFIPLYPVLLQNPFGLFLDGGYAVQLFFVLSGRVLGVSLIKRNTTVITGQLVRRPVRLIVPMIVTWYFILVFKYLCPLLTSNTLALRSHHDEWSTFRLMTATIRMFSGWSAPTIGLGASEAWTLPWELWGSIFVYILAATHLSMRRQSIMFPLIVYAVARWHDSFFSLFTLGYILCYCREKGYFIKPSNRMINITVQLLLFISVWIMNHPVALKQKGGGDKPSWPGHLFRSWLNQFMHFHVLRNPKEAPFVDPFASRHVRCETDIWGIVLLLILLEYSHYLRAFFSSKISIFLGRISFGLYLSHISSFRFFVAIFPIRNSYPLLILSICFAFSVAWILTHLGDTTALKLSHLAYRLFVDNRSWYQIWQDRSSPREIFEATQTVALDLLREIFVEPVRYFKSFIWSAISLVHQIPRSISKLSQPSLRDLNFFGSSPYLEIFAPRYWFAGRHT